jgi:hypothetical protein
MTAVAQIAGSRCHWRWVLASSLAPEIGGLACVVLLAAALHNCWTMTLIIISRPG